MKEVTAIKVIQKDAEFLGLGFLSMMKFIETLRSTNSVRFQI